MSFLDSVLSSIETGKPSRLPPTSVAPSPPVSSSTAKAEVRRPIPVSRDVATERKPLATGTKRKAEEPLTRPAARPAPAAPARTTTTTTTTSRYVPTATKPRSNVPSRPTATTAIKSRSSTPQKAPPMSSSKAPPKGSYADIIARAKAAQEKAPTTVGMFKHQAAPKEKISKVERKKRAIEAQTKEKDARSGKKPGTAPGATANVRSGDSKPAKKRDPEVPSYKGTARPTPSSGQSEYRGTSGLPARKNPGDRHAQSRANRRSRMDEYLGTDEEDEGEYADDYDDYYSESSDMEAGLDAMEREEADALAVARREDEEEWKAEEKAKQEKMERRKRLAELSSRR
ncbi:hypothetical protein BO70DRAFT_381651 [Aspergillus heteromorphus CBS 117.55]|uniref:SPT2-domain-containing protein n=1 Tax=Aspergillus heteromorphus CBS 117.55 TaxID=1448321 RepID=A0A317VH71_9EURO|nr:uncharacterized protein BO70DRAFT_381651 [Aspergillus heteromorphus CBS 117.55]PWY73704.1 hypothetical protein BO70DRAFT_381651 [Aspergillus heteromorphus CBS 117.55]